jgi:outer membrane lipopolysaccharide assembly protein LptE/RlpB
MKTFFIALILLITSSCGYHLQGSGSILPPDVKRIAILPSQNLTTEPGLGVKFTEALRSRFERYGVVEIVESGADRDAELITKILSVSSETRSTSGNSDVAQELDLVVNISAELRRTNGQVLYTNPLIQRREPMATSGGLVVTTSSSFSQGNIGAQTLSGLSSREVARGQQEQVLEQVLDDVSRVVYLNSVAADF